MIQHMHVVMLELQAQRLKMASFVVTQLTPSLHLPLTDVALYGHGAMNTQLTRVKMKQSDINVG